MSEFAETETTADGDAVRRPALTLKSLTFSDGTKLELSPDDIVVIVGPNNAGKSAALREIEGHIGNQGVRPKVITSAEVRKIGTRDELLKFIEENSHRHYQSGTLHFAGHGYNLQQSMVAHSWSNDLRHIRPFFCRRIKTETRITDSDPAKAFKVLTEPAANPIQTMYTDSRVEERLSGYFRSAFGKELIVFKAGGSEIPLLVGQRPPITPGEDRTDFGYIKRLGENTIPLSDQGDGMRSFVSVILQMLVLDTPTMLLLDEPEAFLHPPQARLLGEFLARERPRNAQLFIATHSADVLTGLLEVAPDQMRLIRVERDGSINRVKELEKGRAKEIASDPLMKYSSVFSGIFYQRAILCEADADCLFYQAVLSRISTGDGTRPDVLFLHASGKHRMASIAEALRELGVPVDVVADVDLLSEEDTFERLVAAMGGDWSAVRPHWAVVKKAVEERRPPLDARAVKLEISQCLDELGNATELPAPLRRKIETVLKRSKPWEGIKEAGDQAIPRGNATRSMKALREICDSCGIWLVPVGEMEGFCKSVPNHGPKWVQQVLDEYDLGTDPELEAARAFMTAVWGRAI
jgi:ABC-type transport system involved in cytochrome c biogenesis ATPase subunit